MTIAIDDGAGEGPTAPLNEETAAVASIVIQMMSSWTKRKCYENFLGSTKRISAVLTASTFYGGCLPDATVTQHPVHTRGWPAVYP